MNEQDHDWHMFDEEKGYEVKRVANMFQVRRHGNFVTTLTKEEFDQWLNEGANPEGLD